MIDHYVEQVFTGGFKAQVVGNCRDAAVKYKSALEEALKEKITALETDNAALNVDIDKLKQLEVAVIISGSHNDSPDVKQYTQSTYHEKQIARFKKPFGTIDDQGVDGNVGIIVVTDMLLTGFDAPIEQVLYLDRIITAHNLLQAIARVNRNGPGGKDCGFVVDFVGVGNHLKRALSESEDKEDKVESGKIKEIIDSLSNDEEENKNLQNAKNALTEFCQKYNLTDYSDIDAFFDLFYDEDIRAEFINLYQELNRCFAIVLPRKEALAYLSEWKSFTEIYALAQKHFRDDRFSMKGIPRKLQAIADEYLQSKGIDEKVKPIVITSPDFKKSVIDTHKRTKTKAAAVEHAIRQYIDVDIDDPTLQETFSKMLMQIFANFKNNWDKIFEELEKLREAIRQQENEPTYGLRKRSQMPFFRIFKRELIGEEAEPSEEQISELVSLTQDISEKIKCEIALKGFWESVSAQNRLKGDMQSILISRLAKFPMIRQKYSEILTYIMETAHAIHTKILTDNE